MKMTADEWSIHYRHILLFFFRDGKTAAEACEEICEVYGDVIDINDCEKWFERFENGILDLEDKSELSEQTSPTV